jgi:hypothetical protein
LRRAEGDGVIYTVTDDDISKHLPVLLGAVNDIPLFAYLDPCGLAIPLDEVARIFDRPSGVGLPATEVLINLTAHPRRFAGMLCSHPGEPPEARERLPIQRPACGRVDDQLRMGARPLVGKEATIPSKVDQDANRLRLGSKGGRPPAFDPDIYKQRHAVECGIKPPDEPVTETSGRESQLESGSADW